MFNIKEKFFWSNFENDYSKLFYYLIKNTLSENNVYNYAKEDVEDVYQEILLKIYKNKEKIFNEYNEERSKFSTYLSVISVRVVISYLPKINKKYEQNNYEVLEEKTIECCNEENIFNEDIIEKIFSSNILTEREKLIIKLFYIKELNSKEIRDILDITDSTVRVTKNKAIKKLKEHLTEEGEDNEMFN